MDASTISTEQTPPREKLGVGPMVAIVVLILMFAAGGVYFFLREQARLSAPPVIETINS